MLTSLCVTRFFRFLALVDTCEFEYIFINLMNRRMHCNWVVQNAFVSLSMFAERQQTHKHWTESIASLGKNALIIVISNDFCKTVVEMTPAEVSLVYFKLILPTFTQNC